MNEQLSKGVVVCNYHLFTETERNIVFYGPETAVGNNGGRGLQNTLLSRGLNQISVLLYGI